MSTHIALDVGGTHVAGAVVDLPARALVPGTYRYHTIGPSGTAAQTAADIACCAIAVARLDDADLAIAIPGPFDYDAGIGRFRDVAKFDHLDGVDVGALVRAQLPAEPIRLTFVNDAHAFGIGEYLAGPAKGTPKMLAITLGTGVGSAFMRDGTPLTAGTSVPPEGRLDLLRIDGRPLEATLSRRALIGAYEHRAGQAQHADDVLDIAARARAGEPVAREVLAAAFSAFGRALAPWLVRFRPQTVVLGGSVSRAFDLFIPALAAGLDQGAAGIRRQIRITRAGSENSALLGAAWAAAQHGPHDSAPQTARKRRA